MDKKTIEDFHKLLLEMHSTCTNTKQEALVFELSKYYEMLKSVNTLSNVIQNASTLKQAKELAYNIHCIIEGRKE